jgi:hypothetical protein
MNSRIRSALNNDDRIPLQGEHCPPLCRPAQGSRSEGPAS